MPEGLPRVSSVYPKVQRYAALSQRERNSAYFKFALSFIASVFTAFGGLYGKSPSSYQPDLWFTPNASDRQMFHRIKAPFVPLEGLQIEISKMPHPRTVRRQSTDKELNVFEASAWIARGLILAPPLIVFAGFILWGLVEAGLTRLVAFCHGDIENPQLLWVRGKALAIGTAMANVVIFICQIASALATNPCIAVTEIGN